MQVTINKHYDFIFDPGITGEQYPFSLWNGIYLVERTLTYADMATEGIDLYESLYAPIGKGKPEFELNVESYLDDIFYKLVSPKTEKEVWVPENIVMGYPDPNVKEYHAVMVTADLGIHDNPLGVLAVKDIVESDIRSAVGTGIVNQKLSSPITKTTSTSGGTATIFEVGDSSLFNVGEVVEITETNSYNRTIDDTCTITGKSGNLIRLSIPFATVDTYCSASCDYVNVTTQSITNVNTFNGNVSLVVSSTTNFLVDDNVTIDGTVTYDGTYSVLEVLSSTEMVVDCVYGISESIGTVTTTDVFTASIGGNISDYNGNARITTSSSTTNFKVNDTITITNTSKHNGVFTITEVGVGYVTTNCPFDRPGETGILSVYRSENLNPAVDINVYNTEWMTVEQYNVLKEQRRNNRDTCNKHIINYYESWKTCQTTIEELNTRIASLEEIIISSGI